MKTFREYLEEGLRSKAWNFFKIGLILMFMMGFHGIHGIQYNRLADKYANEIRPECEFSREINDMSPRMTEEFTKEFKKEIGLITNLKNDFNISKERFIKNNKRKLAAAADNAYIKARLNVKNQERDIELKSKEKEQQYIEKELELNKKQHDLNKEKEKLDKEVKEFNSKKNNII